MTTAPVFAPLSTYLWAWAACCMGKTLSTTDRIFPASTADGFDVAAGFRVPPTFTTPAGLERLDLDEVEAAHTTHMGPYSELPTAYEDLQTEAEAAGRTVARDGPMWEEYWSEPGTPEDQIRTEIYWPLSPVH